MAKGRAGQKGIGGKRQIIAKDGSRPQVEISEQKRDSMIAIIEDLQARLGRIEKERMVADRERRKEAPAGNVKAIIEEIHIPSLESIRQGRKR